jgi:hypothetical protein
VVVPDQLVDLLPVLVVLDELDDRSGGQLSAMMLATETEHAQIGEVRSLCELIVIEQLIVRLLLDGRLDAIRCTQGSKQLVAFGDINFGTWNMQGGLRFPRQCGALTGEAHHVIARHGLALIGYAQEVAAVRGRCNGHGSRNAQFDVLAAIRREGDIRQHRHIHGALRQLATQCVRQVWRDALVCRGLALPILNPQQ